MEGEITACLICGLVHAMLFQWRELAADRPQQCTQRGQHSTAKAQRQRQSKGKAKAKVMPKVMAAANARETRRLVGHHARKQAGIVHVLSAAPTEAHDK